MRCCTRGVADISNNEAPNYLKQQLESIEFATAYPTAMSYFSDSFYSRLFDVHPFSQNLFKDVRSQGKFLTKMISLSLTEFYDPTKYELTLRKLAEVHNERGVKAAEYGIVGEVLFWALKRVLGTEVFDAARMNENRGLTSPLSLHPLLPLLLFWPCT